MSENGETDRAREGNGTQPPDDLEKLRSLLLAPEQKEIDELKRRLGQEGQAEMVSDALPQAIRLSSARDGQFSKAITPAVESALKESVRRDPTVLTDAVFPIIGPAIRKAISEAFEKMMQSLNQTMEHSLSVQGLKWRMEAARTGKSFAEVVLLRTLVYRVEQVFLIHKETGLLLQHVEAANVTVKDTDMVSGMLTAIQDFAHDSFRVSKGEGLETLQVGELNVWIESGPHATVAAVIRGVASQDYRQILQDAVERVEAEHHDALEAFTGDARPFAETIPILKGCLAFQLSERRARGSPLVWLVPLLLLILEGSAWLVWNHALDRRAAEVRRAVNAQAQLHAENAKRRSAASALAAENARWAECVEKMRRLEGIVVIEAARRNGTIYLSGLRDPLASDPRPLIVEAGFDPGALSEHWEPYYALSPALALKRATSRLAPPASVRLRWQGDTLVAEGSARASWIAESRIRAESIPGVAAYDASAVLDESSAELAAKKKEIEETAIYYGEGIQLDSEQMAAIRRLARQIVELQIAAARASQRVSISVIGHTTEKGTDGYNHKLGEQRAGQIVGMLAANGVPAALLAPVSVGSREPENVGATPEEAARNRRVTFRVAIDPANRNSPSQ